LESFFDKVSIPKLYNILEQYQVPHDITAWIYKICTHYRVNPPLERKDPRDASQIDIRNLNWNSIGRISAGSVGVPQGLPLSPLLATLLLEKTLLEWGAVMYADDGLIAVDKPE